MRVAKEVETLNREDAVENSRLESDNIAMYPDTNQFLREFPQRKISATRTFPLGCGRNAPLISNEEYLKHVSSEKGSSSVGCERTSSELRPYSEKTIRNEANHAGEKVQDGYVCGNESDNIATVYPDPNQFLREFLRRKISATRTFPPGCGRNTPFISNPFISNEEYLKHVSSEKGSSSVNCERTSSELRPYSEKTIRNEANHAGEKVQDGYGCGDESDNIARVYPDPNKFVREFPQRKISATRTFPPGCGRNAPLISNEEYLKHVSSEKGSSSVGCERTSSELRRYSDKIIRNEANHAGEKVQDGYACGNESDNIATVYPDPNQLLREFTQRKISATRTFPLGCGRNALLISNEEYLKPVSSEKGSSSVVCERTNSELRPYSEKTIKNEANHAGEKVQDGYACRHSLMGASNCRCRQGMGINEKKHKLTAVESISGPSEKKQKTENMDGVPPKKKVPPRRQVIFLDPGQIIAKQKVDKEGENVINGCKAIEALKLYRKILKEEGKKNSSKRIDIQAFNRLKMEMQGWDDSRKPILGSIPGVEVGAKFQYRVELSVVGLHLQFQAGIEYLEKGGKIIATSIVASGGYDNEFDGSDVLVYCGQGGKSMKSGKGPKNQKLKRGNIALKNSFYEKNSVRVILGSNEVEGSDSINARGKTVPYFVYNGLYLVEKLEEEEKSDGPTICKFRLRRLPGQPDLHLGKNSKKREIH